MLQLKNVVKTYVMGDTRVDALRGVDLDFRKNEFVSILGPSGCGKTTLLNIIGGLDRYTSGDLLINNVSTRQYQDVDWDIYRNNSIGFVFQSYNLISHQTVYANIELALTLAGVSRAERQKRVMAVLEQVGLSDQVNKKPTQMSGGQMQRVAIARALVNNPDILLADEPTGALDSETSLQIMKLLEEIAKDRLVIMVTHNAELAAQYSNRVIRLLDGQVTDDSNPFSWGQAAVKKEKGRKKVSMSFPTALSLSFKNLLTKKTRTILTSFAGSIGIIGIALILSLSNGMQTYVKSLERDTFSAYPLELESQTMDMAGMISVMMEHNRGASEDRELDKVYANNIMTNMVQSITSRVKKNDLAQFKQYIESADGQALRDATNTIQYRYNVDLQIFKPDTTDGIVKINPTEIFAAMGMGSDASGMGMSMGMNMGNSEIWSEMLNNQEILEAQYDIVDGHWPQMYNEVVLVLNKDNELSDVSLYALGLRDAAELDALMQAAMKGEEYEPASADATYTYEDLLNLTYKLILNTDYYVKEDGIWVDRRENVSVMKGVIENALELRVVGIIRPSDRASAASISGSVGYTAALTDYLVEAILKTDIAKEQQADPAINVFTGISFDVEDYIDNMTMEDVMAMIATMPEEEQGRMQMLLDNMPEEEIVALFAEQLRADSKKATYEDNLTALGIADTNIPSAIRLYPKSFDSKKQIETLISDYNKAQQDADKEDQVINYTDFVGLMTSSMSNVINIISIVLIGFVTISLVVSSIMIAIITYISVLERTKEIGILRSIGASKKDITRVFNAETIIEGLVAGTMGVGITLLLNIPINLIVTSLSGISNISSALPVWGAGGLIGISILLTLLAGLIPSIMAAKKDPVVALRTE